MTVQWINEYGKPFADYEVRLVESDDWRDAEEAGSILGFSTERFEFAAVQAVSCDTCGALFTNYVQHLRTHRRKCGWPNGALAVPVSTSLFGVVTDIKTPEELA